MRVTKKRIREVEKQVRALESRLGTCSMDKFDLVRHTLIVEREKLRNLKQDYTSQRG